MDVTCMGTCLLQKGNFPKLHDPENKYLKIDPLNESNCSHRLTNDILFLNLMGIG